MKKLNEIFACKDFIIFDNDIFTININNYFLVNNVIVNNGLCSIRGYYENNVVIFEEKNFETFIYNNKSQLIKHIPEYALIIRKHIVNNKFIVAINNGINIQRAIFDIKNFEILKLFNDFGFLNLKLVIGNFFVSSNNSDIGLFNFENENIWKINIKEILEDETVYLHNEILEINNKLFFIISGQEKGHFLYCLNIETGTVLYKYEGLFGFLTKDDKYIYSQKFENILCKINTETGELEQWNVNDLLIENGFESIADHRTTSLNEIVYFTQTIGDNKAKFGLLDTKKKELIFKYNFEPKNGGIGKIEVNETRVYIHTQDNTLHIFENQKINEV